MSFRKLLSLLVVLTMVSGAALFARGGQEEAAEKDERPVVEVGSNVQIPLRIYYEGEQIKGYEYEVYKEALNRAGYKVEVVDVAFAGIFAGLKAEKWNIAASNIYVTKSRAESMDFSNPYLESYDAVMVREDSDIDSLEDLEGKIVGTEGGTTQAAYARRLEDQYGPFEEIRKFEDVETQMLDLENGRIDALTLGHPTAVVYRKERGIFEILGTSKENFMIAAFFRKGDPLRDEFNAALKEMKQDGTTAELFEKYFDEPPAEGTAPVRVFEEPYVPEE